MGIRDPKSFVIAALVFNASLPAFAGKHGFADKKGGGKDDPVIEVSASVGPDAGARFSLSPTEANGQYAFNPGDGRFGVTPPPLIPRSTGGGNHFLTVKFPFKISSAKVKKSLMKGKAKFAGTSFLTPNISITDESENHVRGIPTIAGRTAQGAKIGKEPGFPSWTDDKDKNRLIHKKTFTYIADDGDGDVNTPAAFGAGTDPTTSAIAEVRVRIDKVDGVIINGFWVLKIDDGFGGLAGTSPPPSVLNVTPDAPVLPEKFDAGGAQVVETSTRFVVRFSEPVVPWSVGFAAADVKDFNADGPPLPLIYNGNTAVVPNIDVTNLAFPFRVNSEVRVVADNGAAGYQAPFDVRPINPNNLAEFILNPLVDLPGKLDVDVRVIPEAANLATSLTGIPYSTSVISLYDVPFDDVVTAVTRFHTAKGRGFVNAPVAPSAVLYLPASGGGIGAINLDGNGFETNHPDTEKLVVLTNNTIMCGCPVTSGIAGSHLNGCNANTFGDASGNQPIGIAGNPDNHIGPSTPVPGVNEGSTGSTAGPSYYPPGFETVVKDSTGDPRLTDPSEIGALSDGEIGGFLDALFFDSENLNLVNAVHLSSIAGVIGGSNFISDPPMPNPPPLRLPVGLPATAVVFSQQKLLQPAFQIEADEVWTGCVGCSGCLGLERVLLLPNPVNPLAGDVIPPYPQNGPAWQSFQNSVSTYAARQQIGNFVYVTDRDAGDLVVLNSNTFGIIDRISLPDPWGVGLAPDLKRVYVSNIGDDTVSVVGTDPFMKDFHSEIARVKVGSGPVAVSVQPDGEDVHICNMFGDSVSVLDTGSMTIRTTYSGPMKRPVDVVLTPRFGSLGWLSGIYLGYVASQKTGDLLIYESGPGGGQGLGADDIKWAASQSGRFDHMTSLAYDPLDPPGIATSIFDPTKPNPLVSGVYVAHQDEDTGLAMVTRVSFVKQLPTPGAFPNNPLPGSVLNSPGVLQRIFEPVSTWGGPLSPLISQVNPSGKDQVPADIAMSDITTANFHQAVPTVGFENNFYKTNLGSRPAVALNPVLNHKTPWRVGSIGEPIPTYIPDRMYVSFTGDDRIVVLDPTGTNPAPLNQIEGVPSPGKLIHWFDQ